MNILLEVVVQNSVYSRSRIRGQNNFWIDSKTIFGGDFDIQTWLLRCGCSFKIFRSQSSQTGYCDSVSIKGRPAMQKTRVKKNINATIQCLKPLIPQHSKVLKCLA